MKFLKLLMTLITGLALTIGMAHADEGGTKADAEKMVAEALAYIKEVGPDKAFQEFSTPGGRWHVKDVYLFCYKADGTNVCHGANKALIGKNLIDIKTADGQLLIKNMAELTASKGKGWIDYQWTHPQSKKIEGKRAVVQKIPGYDGFLGAGIYQ